MQGGGAVPSPRTPVMAPQRQNMGVTGSRLKQGPWTPPFPGTSTATPPEDGHTPAAPATKGRTHCSPRGAPPQAPHRPPPSPPAAPPWRGLPARSQTSALHESAPQRPALSPAGPRATAGRKAPSGGNAGGCQGLWRNTELGWTPKVKGKGLGLSGDRDQPA